MYKVVILILWFISVHVGYGPVVHGSKSTRNQQEQSQCADLIHSVSVHMRTLNVTAYSKSGLIFDLSTLNFWYIVSKCISAC